MKSKIKTINLGALAMSQKTLVSRELAEKAKSRASRFLAQHFD
jgi:hypothetical protein